MEPNEPTIQEKLEQIHKDVKSIKRRMFWGSIFNLLIIVLPLGLLLYFLPNFINNLLQVYLPEGADQQNIQQILHKLFQQQLQQPR